MHITLNEHQVETVYRIIKAKDKHGLLIWHEMGTGKTLTAIALILQYPKIAVNIVCPADIKFVWENEFRKVPQIKNRIRFFTYEKHRALFDNTTFKNELLIMDEAHHIVPILKKADDKRRKIALFNTSLKTLLLTGTPIYNSVDDMTYLINLAAGKILLPYNHTEFRKMFYRIRIRRSIFHGWTKRVIWPILQSAVIRSYASSLMVAAELRSLSHAAFAVTKLYAFFLYGTMIHLKYDKLEDYRHLNIPRFGKVISPYVSFYKIPNLSKEYPRVETHTTMVPYTTYQTYKWLELTHTCLNIKEVDELQLTAKEDIEYYSDKLDLDTFKKIGLSIGNLNNPETGEFSEKFYRILDVAYNKRAVFYSSFTKNGILKFRDFLDYMKVGYLYMDNKLTLVQKNVILDTFRDKTVFLLLHPRYIEGINIMGCEQIHLLEPIPQSSLKEQIIARGVRYLSHAHLPENERVVYVYQWGCSVTGLLDTLHKWLISIHVWSKLNPEVYPAFKSNQFTQRSTPDELVINDDKIATHINSELSVLLDKNVPSMDCCIRYINKNQEQECLEVLGKYCR